MSTLTDVLTEIQGVVAAVTNIRGAPTYAPESLGTLSGAYAIAYIKNGSWTGETGAAVMRGLHNVVVEIHLPRGQDLPKVIEAAMPFSNSVPNAIYKAMRDGTFQHLDTFGALQDEFGPLGWGGVDTFGWRFTLTDVKTREIVS